LILFLSVATTISGCASSPQGGPLTEATRDEIHSRTDQTFTNALFFKPQDNGSPDAFGLAPLIVQEAVATNSAAQSPDRLPTIEKPVADIYFQRSQTWIHGKPHDQLTYFWRHREWIPRSSNSAAPIQGIRMTLDSHGRPAIWEIATDSLGITVIYVSQAVEKAAAEEFGRAITGRQFSVEQSLSKTPDVIVARIVDATPEPTGPVIYIRATTGDVLTILCRCSPPQVKNFVAQGYYGLVTRLDEDTATLLAKMRKSNAATRFWREDQDRGSHLEDRLRLPKSF
jgi:hypothetical protein